MLADNFQEEIRYINTVGVQDGCVELFLQLRQECVSKIFQAATEKPGLLPGVKEVTILGDKIEVIPIENHEDSKNEECEYRFAHESIKIHC